MWPPPEPSERRAWNYGDVWFVRHPRIASGIVLTIQPALYIACKERRLFG